MKGFFALILSILALIILSQCTSASDSPSDPTSSNEASEKRKVEKPGINQNEAASSAREIPELPQFKLSESINQDLVAAGKTVFDSKCTMCHKTDAAFIGPSPQGVLQRRSPDWIMKLIMYPDLMREQDSVAKRLVDEYNGAIMPNQNVSFEEARSILEYFRTLEA